MNSKITLIVAVLFITCSSAASAQFGSEKKENNTLLHGNRGTSYNTIGNTTFGSDGSSYNRIGKTTFDNKGNNSNRIGNTTFNSNGTSSTQIGSTLFNSDGSTVNKIGNSTFGSDGTICNKIGNTTFCNWERQRVRKISIYVLLMLFWQIKQGLESFL